jgi:hypothetical protein
MLAIRLTLDDIAMAYSQQPAILFILALRCFARKLAQANLDSFAPVLSIAQITSIVIGISIHPCQHAFIFPTGLTPFPLIAQRK